jgi:hypothetical protein
MTEGLSQKQKVNKCNVRQRHRCSWCQKRKPSDRYLEGSDKFGNFKPRWICDQCYQENFGGLKGEA